jgi:nucleoside-diphosphate-sugar epimerase
MGLLYYLNPLFVVAVLSASSVVPALSMATDTSQRVAVIGATGRLGQAVVRQLFDEKVPCKILLRRPLIGLTAPITLTKDSSKDEVAAYLASLDNVQVAYGDVSDVSVLRELFSDCTACLAVYGSTRRSKISDIWTNAEDDDPTHAKQINYQGVANILEAAKASKTCKRIVRITGKGETPTSVFSILINMLGSMAKAWNYQAELLLRGQDEKDMIDYTIIRPGIMSEEGPEGNVLTLGDDGADLKVSKIRYADIASLCIDCLDYPNAAQTTLTAMTVDEGDGESSWGALLKTVAADRREFPTDMLEQSKAAVRKAVAGIGTFAAIVLAIILQALGRTLF